ncbi:putative phosphohydrolase [Marinitoga piezophila KA3]|uniref:Putative phosphohydrolase n=1 Tax=Marinitoga piezophila (strain DSM 14283 / JCM 11233 / KA3) TaxID=443254 RepID=H2J5H9_MARPK|nr:MULTISPECIES: metallophosphoesterase [Marinitoga]AEX86123.1 putative phosphohydrolase [Marinitoga piezophila KA3]
MKNFKAFISLIIIISIYSIIIEPFSLQKSYLSIDIPEYNGNIKIIHITDLHMYKYIFFHDKILNEIKKENPDLILYTGDSIIKNTEQKDLTLFFKLLGEIAPVYLIYGNWDYYDINKVNNAYNNKNIHIINDNTTILKIKELNLKLIGLPIYKQITRIDTTPASYTITLEHIPDTIFYNKEVFDQSNLILAGHTHGGQIYIPYLTKKILKKYAFYLRGKKELDKDKIMYINRGLGAWFNIRLFSSPEILVIELH